MTKLYCVRSVPPLYEEEMKTEIIERVFQLDGYQVGDRLLEGVLFDIYFTDTGVVIDAKIENKSSKKYFEDNLNANKWYQKVKDCAKDILDEGDEVDVPKFIRDKYFKNGINAAYIINE
jgi:hypothetical protein